MVAVSLLILVILGVEATFDYQDYRSVQTTLKKPQEADAAQLERGERWLESYYLAHWFRHRVCGFIWFSRKEAWAALNQIHDSAVAKYWTEVQTRAPDRVAQIAPAKAMLERFPNCDQVPELKSIIAEGEGIRARDEQKRRFEAVTMAADEVTKEKLAILYLHDYPKGEDAAACQAIVQEAQAKRKIQENRDALQVLVADFNNLVSSKSEEKDEYQRVRQRVKDLPVNKDSETKDLAEQRNGLAKKIDDRHAEIEMLVVDRKNAQNIAFITEQDRRLEGTSEVDDLRLVVAAIGRGMLHADVASSDIQLRYMSLLIKARGKLDDGIRRAAWKKFEDEYHALVRRNNLREAAQRLAEKEPDSSELNALKTDFIKKSLPQLADKKTELIKGRQWDRGREVLKTFRTDKYVKKLVADDQLRKVEDMEHEVDVAEDQYLYTQVENRKTRTSETIQKYLADAPLKTMKKKVEDYGCRRSIPWQFREKRQLFEVNHDDLHRLRVNRVPFNWKMQHFSGCHLQAGERNTDVVQCPIPWLAHESRCPPR